MSLPNAHAIAVDLRSALNGLNVLLYFREMQPNEVRDVSCFCFCGISAGDLVVFFEHAFLYGAGVIRLPARSAGHA